MLLTVATTPTELRAATEEMEFREVLILYHHRRRSERERDASELERLALGLRADALVRGVHSDRALSEVNDLLHEWTTAAARLREPETEPEREIDPGELAFLLAAYKPGV